MDNETEEMKKRNLEEMKKAANVIVYSTPSCQFCTMAKQFLDNNGIPYQEHDVSTDQEMAKEMVMKSRQRGVPVLEVNGRIIVGFRPDVIEKALVSPKVARDSIIGNLIYDPFDQ